MIGSHTTTAETLESYLELHDNHSKERVMTSTNAAFEAKDMKKAAPILKAKLYDFSAVDNYEQQAFSRKNAQKEQHNAELKLSITKTLTKEPME